MRSAFLLLMVIAITCAGCAHSKKASSANNQSPTTTSSSSSHANDGSSFEKAIVIEEKSDTKGVSEEYAWIRKNYPGSKVLGQSLSYKDKKPYDIISIETADGDKKAIYFDISRFFGKF